tara:strand:+ start:1403 stop:2353 length:951 start_codon:yes stop_codon:yes gene_type:complete
MTQNEHSSTPLLNPAQKDVLSQLGARPSERPEFSDDLKEKLKSKLEEVAQSVSGGLPDNESLFVNKHLLTQLMGCETRYIAESQESFEWSIPTARGTLSHKAIELSVYWQGPKDSLTLTNEAISRAEQGNDYMGDWVRGLTKGDRAQLCGEVNTRVGSFLETWPPLEKRWKPMLETPIRVELAKGKVVLSGKVDLTLGSAGGNTAGKVIVDFKTGKFSPSHRDDLRFYALLDTIRVGVPPRLVASYYLDQGEFSPETINTDVLESTIARVSSGIVRLAELRLDMRPPTTQPGPPCRWCLISDSCDDGQEYLDEHSD